MERVSELVSEWKGYRKTIVKSYPEGIDFQNQDMGDAAR
jgi:hypothetical protein